MSEREPWGRGEIAEALGVTVKAVDAWRRRDDFPAPAYELSHGPIWWADEVREWRRDTVARRRTTLTRPRNSR